MSNNLVTETSRSCIRFGAFRDTFKLGFEFDGGVQIVALRCAAEQLVESCLILPIDWVNRRGDSFSTLFAELGKFALERRFRKDGGCSGRRKYDEDAAVFHWWVLGDWRKRVETPNI